MTAAVDAAKVAAAAAAAPWRCLFNCGGETKKKDWMRTKIPSKGEKYDETLATLANEGIFLVGGRRNLDDATGPIGAHATGHILVVSLVSMTPPPFRNVSYSIYKHSTI